MVDEAINKLFQKNFEHSFYEFKTILSKKGEIPQCGEVFDENKSVQGWRRTILKSLRDHSANLLGFGKVVMEMTEERHDEKELNSQGLVKINLGEDEYEYDMRVKYSQLVSALSSRSQSYQNRVDQHCIPLIDFDKILS